MDAPMTFLGPVRDVENIEVRRRERAERLDKPWGRDISIRSHRVAQIVSVVLLAILLALVVFGWLNVDALRPSELTPAG
jgi:hypothetical protein